MAIHVDVAKAGGPGYKLVCTTLAKRYHVEDAGNRFAPTSSRQLLSLLPDKDAAKELVKRHRRGRFLPWSPEQRALAYKLCRR